MAALVKIWSSSGVITPVSTQSVPKHSSPLQHFGNLLWFCREYLIDKILLIHFFMQSGLWLLDNMALN